MWNSEILEFLLWDCSYFSELVLGLFHSLTFSMSCCKTYKPFTIYSFLIKLEFHFMTLRNCIVLFSDYSYLNELHFYFYFSCLKMVNVMFTASLLTTHLQSIVSLLNWNFMHLSFLLQLWGKAPWALSLIQCWPSLSTRGMNSSSSPSYVPYFVP